MNQLHVPTMTKINKYIIIVFGAIFVLNSIFGQFMGFTLNDFLALSVSGVHTGFISQFITYPFIEQSFMGAIFSALLLWFIGSELESNWGSSFYGRFLTFIVISTGIFFYALSLILGGASAGFSMAGLSGITYSLLLAYGIIYSDRMLTFMLIFPMKAKYFCMLLAGIQLYFAVFSQNKAMGFSHLFAMLMSFAYLRYKSSLAQGGGMRNWMKEKQKNKMRQKMKIVEKEPVPERADPENPKFWQ